PNCKTTRDVGPLGLIQLQTSVPNPYDPTPILDRWTTFANQHPLVITEFGWPAEDNGAYNANLVAGSEQPGLGWVAFAWNGSTVGTFTLVANAGPGAPHDPSPSRVPIKHALAR